MTVSARPEAVTEIHLTGRAASPGLAIGPVTVLTAAVESRRVAGDAAQETAALKAAIEAATADLARLVEAEQGDAADILEFQVAMLDDDALAEGAFDAIAAGTPADHAWRSALDAEIAGYRSADNEYFRARIADLVDIRDRVLAHLNGADESAAIAGGSSISWDQQGITWTVPAKWNKVSDERNSFLVRSPGGDEAANLIGSISPMSEDFPVDISIKAFYDGAKTRLKNGEVDQVKWVEIDGLKGVQFRESNPDKPDGIRRLQWLAYRKYAGQVQMVNIMLSSNGRG